MLPAVAVETEASQMLEAALEQMDDIIAGKSRKSSTSFKRDAGSNSMIMPRNTGLSGANTHGSLLRVVISDKSYTSALN